MKESLFVEYIKKIFPKLATIIEKVNGKRGNKLTYLHKTMVAMDSPLPAKSRDSIAHANGTLPKVGMKKVLRETQINAINIMKAQNASFTNIANKLTNDAVACSVGIDEKNEANFLTALSNGIVIVEDENNTGTGLRINFNYLPANCFGVETPNVIVYDDIKNVLSKADADGNSITTIMLALSTYNAIRQTQWAKELVANYRGQTVVEGTKLPVPTASLFDEAFADDNNGIKFLKVDRTVISEKNGKRKPYKPWNANKIIFLTTEEVGALVWGTLAEKTNPVSGVVYSTVDEYKLISKYSKNDPLQEFTSGQALVLPVIENVDQIYSLDITEGQLVDTAAESSDTGDEKITVWGQAYKKPEFVTEYNKIRGSKLPATYPDDKLIAAVNKLSDEEEAALKAAVESHKSE